MQELEMEDGNPQRSRADWHKSLFSRRTLKTFVVAFAFIVISKLLWSYSFQSYLPTTLPSYFYLQHGSFETFSVGRFVNTADLSASQCQELRHDGDIQMRQSFHLNPDLQSVASQLQGHPMVVYLREQKGLTSEDMIANYWSEKAGSNIWLAKYKAYLSVTRIIFHLPGEKDMPIISFLRGQLYDANWVELKDHTITWKGEAIVFPLLFDITTPYENEGAFFGPEDPQITIEDCIDNAEPVVTFSMLTDLENPIRALYVYRPFTNDLTPLTIHGENLRAVGEKNWSPFFYHSHPSSSVIQQKWPTNYIHFVQSYTPLVTFRCHLLNGQCVRLYEQDIPEELAANYTGSVGTIEGGTNLIPIPMKGATGSAAYIGFTHSHADAGCIDGPIYTPQLVVMTASSDSHFHLDFVSDPIDFRPALLPSEAPADPCGQARTIVANGISRWDRSGRQDIVTVSLSADGSSVQTVRLYGLLDYVNRLPFLRQSLKHDIKADEEAMWDLRWSVVGSEALTCALGMSYEYSAKLAAIVNGIGHGNEIQNT